MVAYHHAKIQHNPTNRNEDLTIILMVINGESASQKRLLAVSPHP